MSPGSTVKATVGIGANPQGGYGAGQWRSRLRTFSMAEELAMMPRWKRRRSALDISYSLMLDIVELSQ